MPAQTQLLIQCTVQYSPFITSHKHGIFSVAPRNFFRGMVNYHAWKRVLPRQKNSHRWQLNGHVWLILKQCHVQSFMSRKHTILTVLKLMYTVLLTDNSCFTGITNAPYKLCLLWIAGSQQL